jgi:hypothetical protein
VSYKVFIFGLFKETGTVSGCMASGGGMNSKQLIGKRKDGSGRGLF